MQEKILLGTYTRRKSKGIYSIVLDTKKEDLTDLTLMTEETSPTYLSESRDGYIYSVTSVDDKGGTAAYDRNFNLVNTVVKDGAPVCYTAVDETRGLVYGANYHEGEVNVYKILKDGSLEAADTIVHDEPTGSHENQDSAHAHYADLTPDKRLAVCDLGTDRVYTYDVSDDGILTETAVYTAEDATGPRHLIFHPNGRYAYLFGELDSTVTVLSYEQETGVFTELQKVSTLPEGYSDFNAGAAVKITKDGKFLYLSNRGHNSIAVFKINADGSEVTFVEHVSTEGSTPRDFSLSPDDQFLIAANLDSDNLTLYRRNSDSGRMSVIKKDIYAPEVVCVLFTK